jgi:hypothetical protein
MLIGKSWVKQPGGLHLFKFPPEVLKSLTKSDASGVFSMMNLNSFTDNPELFNYLRNPGVELVSLAGTDRNGFQIC